MSATYDDLSDEMRVNDSQSYVPATSGLFGFVDPKTNGLHDDGTVALLVRVQVPDQPGVLHSVTRFLFRHQPNITCVALSNQRQPWSATYFELRDVQDPDALVADLEALEIMRTVEREPAFWRLYGTRIIVIGGGAQVGQVVLGAVAEADLVVTDPVQAGVMTVMLAARTARFDVRRQGGRRY